MPRSTHSMDLQVPTFVAFSRAKDKKEFIIMGFGTHFDPTIALLRALTEMNQSMMFFEKKDLDPATSDKERIIKDWIQNATIEKHPYLIPNPLMPRKRHQDYVRLDAQDLKEDVLTCKKLVESKGMEMLVLDQTRPDVGLFVVKVVVPGLRHFWNRYEKGRLFDVPLQLGYVPRKLKEEELNPIAMFL